MPNDTTIVQTPANSASRYAAFMEEMKLVRYVGRYPCLHLLLKKARCFECSHMGPDYGWRRIQSSGWWDHYQFWRRRGERHVWLATSEPYLNQSEYDKAVPALRSLGLTLARGWDESMWYPGHTTLLYVTATEPGDFVE